jgi:hypothetical protein
MANTTKSIWKFVLTPSDCQTIRMPPNSRVLSAQAQREEICIWALVNTDDTSRCDYHVWVYGTGCPVEEAAHQGRYVATVQLARGSLVFHVFVESGT